jgi:hypothetical protein
LSCLCDRDAVALADVAAGYAATAARAEVKRYPIGHFEIYLGEHFERAVSDQTEFLIPHLGVRCETPGRRRSGGQSLVAVRSRRLA